MRRIVRAAIPLALGLAVLALLVLLLSPAARRLAPTWLYYDLIARQIAPLPPAAEQYVLAAGNDFCSVGRDSACGGYRIVNAHRLQLGAQPLQQGISAAWCVDYVVLRRNASSLTGGLIPWANIPRAMVLAERAGMYEAAQAEGCQASALE